jgi:hemerythrin-like metal-binding protein
MKPLFQWTDAYAVGIGPIDEEHQRLFALAEAMHVAMIAGRGKEFLSTLLAALLDYTSYHFAHEEELMERVCYPGLAEHQRQHEELRARTRELQERAASGEVTMTMEVALFLMDWLKRHTISSDLKIAAFSGGSGLSRRRDEQHASGK